ncbi:MAG: hypothetical protein ABI791_02385 [Acidobacteriota bacterium]
MIRIILAGILGGLAMFFWSAISHGALDFGVEPLSNEAAVVANLQANIAEPGFYFIPGIDMKNSTEAEQAEWTKKYEAGPNAIVIYHPTGKKAFGAERMGTELASNILACAFAAFAISFVSAGFVMRAMIGPIFGLVGWLSIVASYWNWYRFPTKMVETELIDQLGGWLVAGIVIAIIVKGRRALS